MIVKPKIRGFVCITSHPKGCAAHVQQQIDYARSQAPISGIPKRVLIIGASTGYGLATRITAAFGASADTLGVFFERPSDKGRPASAGWYNSVAVESAAHADGLYAHSINGDAFSEEIKEQTIEEIKAHMGQVDLVIYSLASPRRVDPVNGEVYRSTLKPIGTPFTAKSVDTDSGVIEEVTLDPASEEEIAHTIKVMGGEDWCLWMDKLAAAGVLADQATTIAYSYIGPEVTYPIYRHGTIGRAKEHLETTAAELRDRGFRAYVSINKAVVTQASSAIPVVPLYISVFYRIMREKGLHEGCIEQIVRLFKDKIPSLEAPEVDAEGRLRVDDWEMRTEVQDAVKAIWPKLQTGSLQELSDFDRYQTEFLKLFGFGIEGVDYGEDVTLEVPLPSQGA